MALPTANSMQERALADLLESLGHQAAATCVRLGIRGYTSVAGAHSKMPEELLREIDWAVGQAEPQVIFLAEEAV